MFMAHVLRRLPVSTSRKTRRIGSSLNRLLRIEGAKTQQPDPQKCSFPREVTRDVATQHDLSKKSLA